MRKNSKQKISRPDQKYTRTFCYITAWGQVVYPSWWPRPDKRHANRSALCIGII